MKPAELRPGDRIVISICGKMQKRTIRNIEYMDPDPGMQDWCWGADFVEGGSAMMARNHDYATWYPTNK